MKSIVKNIVLAVFCLTAALLSTGCIGMVNRLSLTDSTTFQRISSTPIAPGRARVWVYVIGGGPNAANPTGTQNLISLNQDPYMMIGETFFHLDVTPGEYRVTTTFVVRPIRSLGQEVAGPMGGLIGPGRMRKQINVEPANEYFIRVQSPANVPIFNYSPTKNNYPFDIVTAAAAQPEITPLKHSVGYTADKYPSKSFGKWVEDSK